MAAVALGLAVTAAVPLASRCAVLRRCQFMCDTRGNGSASTVGPDSGGNQARAPPGGGADPPRWDDQGAESACLQPCHTVRLTIVYLRLLSLTLSTGKRRWYERWQHDADLALTCHRISPAGKVVAEPLSSNGEQCGELAVRSCE